MLEMKREGMPGPIEYGNLGTIRNGWLKEAIGETDPNRPHAPMKPVGIVNHFTCSYNAKGTIEWFRNESVSIHFIVDKNGDIYQMTPCEQIAYHAGKSSWKHWTGLNNHFIGIEFVNLGPLEVRGGKFVDCYGREFKGKYHTFDFDGYKYWEQFTDEQMKVMYWLNKTLMTHYHIPVENVIGHQECSPGRKNDPGGSIGMTMDQFRRSLS